MNNKNIKTTEQEDRMIRIQIADASGHTALMLSPGQTQEFVEQQENKWIFVDNMLVRESDLESVNWADVESVRVMPGLVGGAGSEDLSQPLLEDILDGSKRNIFVPEDGKLWQDGRAERVDSLIGLFQESINSNSRALTLLHGVFEENSEFVRVGRNNIIILGELASYCIPIEDLLISFHNVYSENSRSGFRSVEVHPKDHWIRKHKTACIQVDSGKHIPSIDTLTGLILGLLNDNISFVNTNMSPLRDALIELYGLESSPISDLLEEFFKSNYPSIERLNGEFVINGTNGWKWFIGFSDPEINGYSISSSIRDGPKRLIVEDTKNDEYYWGSLERIFDEVINWPRNLKNGDDCYVLENSIGFARMCEQDRVFSRIKASAIESSEDHTSLGSLFG